MEQNMHGYFFLFIEDNDLLSCRINEAAERNNTFLLCKSVNNERDLLSAINNYNWDAIISSSYVKDFSNIEILNLLSDIKCEIPFIIVSDGEIEDPVFLGRKPSLIVHEDNINEIFNISGIKQLNKSSEISEFKDFYYTTIKRKNSEYSELKDEFKKELKIKLDIQKKLVESENRFQSFQELSLDAFFILKPKKNRENRIYDFICSYLNPSAEKMIDTKYDEVVDQEIRGYLPEDIVDYLYKKLIAVIEKNEPDSFEMCTETAGSTYWYRVMAIKIDDGVALSASDISDRKKAEFEMQKLLKAESASRKLAEKLNNELEIANAEFMMMGNMIPFGIWKTDEKGKLLYISKSMLDLLNISYEEMQKGIFLRRFVSHDDFVVYRKWKNIVKKNGFFWDGEYRLYDRFNNIHHVLSRGLPLKNEEGKVISWMGLNLDVTQNRRVQQQLENSLKEQNTFYERISDIFVAYDKEFRFTYINSNGLKTTFSKPNLIGKVLWTVYPELIGTELEYNFRKALEEQKSTFFELNDPAAKSWFLVTVYPSGDGISVYYKDITYHKEAEGKLKFALKEKEVLLKEIHHRVKNNLQLISSMLNLQANFVKDDTTVECFRNSQARIRSMAIVHEQLYHNNVFSSIDLQEYVRKLSDNLAASYSSIRINIRLECEEILVTIEDAINIGLIINEMVLNSLKHAFKGRDEGIILINLHIVNDRLIISIKDNGSGLPKDFDILNTNTFGMQLINALINQMNGDIIVKNKVGTEFISTLMLTK
jgi:two-component sensor histidine kinase/PAS domain-containing protein